MALPLPPGIDEVVEAANLAVKIKQGIDSIVNPIMDSLLGPIDSKIDDQGTAVGSLDGKMDTALAGIISAINAANGAKDAADAAAGGIDGVAQQDSLVEVGATLNRLSLVLTGSTSGWEGGWAELNSSTPTQGLSALKVINANVGAASQAAVNAENKAGEVVFNQHLTRLGFTRYTGDNDGMVSFLSDSQNGKITGNGPIVIFSDEDSGGEVPVFNPLFFMYRGADGVYHPITAGLVADVLNLLNIYPRP